MSKITLNNGGSNPGVAGFKGNTLQQLPVVDWLADLPETQLDTDLVEVQFKNTRKGYYLNNLHLPIEKGDMIAVEASPGHDIGVVTLMGRLVLSQIKKNNINLERYEIKRVYRKVKPLDITKYEEAKEKEHATMIRARQIALDLDLSMKIGDVEYQGDGSKAIFYYIADERVDFRQLIKVFAEVFRVRIEMKQIGARQEAGRIGGIGPCGRELCCTTWKSNFVSVSTVAAKYQDISTNPMKLAGQCAKIKCCINFEAPMYIDAQKDFPSKEVALETLDGTYYHFKTDVFKRTITYSTAPNFPANLVAISVDRAKEVIAKNRKGEKVEYLNDNTAIPEKQVDFENVVGQDSLTRFDAPRSKNNRPKRNKGNNREEGYQDRGERSEKRERREMGDRVERNERSERGQNDRNNRNNAGNRPNKKPRNGSGEEQRRENNNEKQNQNNEGGNRNNNRNKNRRNVKPNNNE